MTGSSSRADALLREYRREVLRWNNQVSLVSRKDPEKTFDRLMVQCREGLGVLLAADPVGLIGAPDIRYFDLGSGGGLPGVVWHVMMVQRGVAPRTTLVEPREKRAWFLDRLRGLEGMPDYAVLQTRWGAERTSPAPGPGAVTLISLKALRLTDREILEGLAEPEAGVRLVIARYYPPGEAFTPDLAKELEISRETTSEGVEVAGVGVSWVPTGASILPGMDFSLLISAYKAASF